jgi:hypothetical protein
MTVSIPRRLRIRWWHLAIATVVLLIAALIATAYAWRAMGRGQYLAVVEQLRAAGRPASVDDFVALAPPVDRPLQDAWDAWQKRRSSGSSAASYPIDLGGSLGRQQKAWDAWVVGQGPRPADVEAIIARFAPDQADALRLLRQGGLVLSGFGWMAKDLPPDKRSLPFTSALTLPNLLVVREVAVWLHHAAVLAEDPRQHLADLDALVAAMERPATLIDAMIALAIANIRDRTYIELALLGRLPDEARQRWLAEPAHNLRLVGDGFAGESALFGHGMAAMIDHDLTPIPFIVENRDWQGFWFGAVIWTTGFKDCAQMIAIETHIAQRLRGDRADSWPTWDQVQLRLGPLGRAVMPNLWESAITAIQADAAQRIARMAVRIIGLARASALPADQGALLAALGDPQALAPGGDQLAVRYEVPAPGRFRLVIDPASPVPDFDDPKRMPQRSKAAGSPPAKEPLMLSGPGGVLEIQLPPGR